MINLIHKATRYTPSICFDAEHHHLGIKGESYPENVDDFYGPVLEWLTEYGRQLTDERIHVVIDLIYFNSSSAKALMNIIDILQELTETGNEVVIDWIFDVEDEDAAEFGEDLKADFEVLQFNLKKREEFGE